jgi:hypothetical protein
MISVSKKVMKNEAVVFHANNAAFGVAAKGWAGKLIRCYGERHLSACKSSGNYRPSQQNCG